MENEKIQIPNELVEALKEHQVIPFIGAGVSRAVEKKVKEASKSFNPLFPSWKEFLDYSVEKLNSRKESDEAEDIKQLLSLKKPMYLEAARRASEALGETLWHQMMKEKLDFKKVDADENSLMLPQIIWELGSNLLITTNVDRVLQWTCPNSEEFRPLDMEKFEIGELQKEKEIKYPTVLYLHGRIHNKRNVVFTPEQYKKFYEEGNNQAKLQVLLNLLTNFTTLFIGFSMDDEYFLRQLNYIDEIYEGGANSFYILLPENEKDNPNIPKYVEKIIYPHHGKPLLDLLERMKQIAKGDDDSDDPNPPQPPDLSPVTRELLTTTSSPRSVNFSTFQKLSKSTLGEKHFNVPFASKRDELVGRTGICEEIWKKFRKNTHSEFGKILNIQGPGGIGKTQVAIEYATKFRRKYKLGVFWIDADTKIDKQLLPIAEEQRWINKTDDEVNQFEISRNKFHEISGSLIIFDNVNFFAQIKDYIPRAELNNHILLTSQKMQENIEWLKLDFLQMNESRELLLKISGRKPFSYEGAKSLEETLKKIAGFPLAIELIGNLLKNNVNISFVELNDLLDEVPLKEIEKKFPFLSRTKHDTSLIRTIKVSEKFLEEEPLSHEIIFILSWSGNSSMGDSLLARLVGAKKKSDFTIARNHLYKLGFVKTDINKKRYEMHPFFAIVFRQEYALNENPLRLQRIVKNLTEWAKDNSANLADFESEIPHLEVWQKNISGNYPIDSIYLGLAKVESLRLRGYFAEALSQTVDLFNFYRKEKIKDKDLLAQLHLNLGVLHGHIGNYKAEKENKLHALRIRRNFFREKPDQIAISLNGVGVALTHLGEHKEALKFKEEALEMRRRLFKEPHFTISQSLNNIGITFGYLAEYPKELEYKEKALRMRQQLLKKAESKKSSDKKSEESVFDRKADVASSYNYVGIAYEHLGNYKKALEYKERALEMRKKLFGEIHSAVANSLNNVGVTYGLLKEYEKALDFKQQAYEIRHQLLDEEHPDRLRSLNDLGIAFSDLGKYQIALKYQLEALEIRRKKFGKKHLFTASSLVNIGITYYRCEDFDNAIKYLNPALTIRTNSLGKNHEETIQTCKFLILALEKSGKSQQVKNLAADFLNYIPLNHSERKFFEETGL